MEKMTYEALWEAYQRVCSENRELRAQIKSRNQADIPKAEIIKKEVSDSARVQTVEKGTSSLPTSATRLSPEEKIELFLSLFIGRTDVYAKRWQSTTSGKSGYQPVCENEWHPEWCNKKKQKCSTCPHRKLRPLTHQAIYQHLSGKDELGRDVLGIYPLLSNEHCRILAIDFDDDHFQEEALAFYNTCKNYHIPAYIERSRSGKGTHVWIFFCDEIPASRARKLGTGLLSVAMNHYPELSFSSYDRIFPNQDTIPSGGFGNLIALPLQGRARKEGNSVFVDETFTPFSDQWSFLQSIRKISAKETDEFIAEVCPHEEFGELFSTSEKGENNDTALLFPSKPWEQKNPQKQSLNLSDFPKSLQITEANQIFIPKKGLSPRAINQIRRLAAFKNPEFFRAQAMRLPIFNKPRIIATATEYEDYIGLPRGCKKEFLSLLASSEVPYTLEDQTSHGEKLVLSFNGTLREDQASAAKALLEEQNGILSAATAFGKTVVGAFIIAKRSVNALLLVHSSALAQQWKKALDQFLTVDVPIGMLGGGVQRLTGKIDIAIMQSLLHREDITEIAQTYGLVLVDECHHIPAVHFEQIITQMKAHYVYGLSATPTRQDGHHPILWMQCGPVRYHVDAKKQALTRTFSQLLFPRFTSFRSVNSRNKHLTQIFQELVQDNNRNKKIVADTLKAVNEGRTPLLLSERTEHVQLLKSLLSGKCKHVISLGLTGFQSFLF